MYVGSDTSNGKFLCSTYLFTVNLKDTSYVTYTFDDKQANGSVAKCYYDSDEYFIPVSLTSSITSSVSKTLYVINDTSGVFSDNKIYITMPHNVTGTTEYDGVRVYDRTYNYEIWGKL